MSLISVIIPLYNKAPYIAKALQSVFSQTYANWELIVVDDGSQDESLAIAQRCIGKSDYTSQCILHHQENSGVGIARNKGVSLSHGQYLCFLDADDWWEPIFLQEMLTFAQAYPDAGIWASNYIYFKPGKTHVGVKHPTGYMNYPKCYVENKGMPVWTGSVMMTCEIFDEMRGFPTDIRLGEDFLLWSKIAHQYKVAFLDKSLAYYNNDVPVTLRATRRLHEPQYNMLFHIDDLVTDEDWRQLIDMLRVDSLFAYYLDGKYHSLAKQELAKVDWTRQPKAICRKYKTPILISKANLKFMKLGSFVKQFIIHRFFVVES